MSDAGRGGVLGRVPPAAWFFGLLPAAWGLERWRSLPLGWTSLTWRLAVSLSLFAGAAAFGILFDSAWDLLAVPLLAPALERLVVREEERRLRELFGEGFAGYAARVRRWL